MNVVDTVTAMIKAWPTMYESRADALKHVFTSSNWKWENGQLVPDEPSEIHSSDSCTNAFAEIADDRSVSARLRISRRNLLTRWRQDNAALLATEEYPRFTHSCLWLPDSWNRFFDMPDDVQDDWKQAAHDTAEGLHTLTENADPNTHEYAAHQSLTKFLTSQGLISNAAVDKRIEELEAELADLRASRKDT